MHWSEFSWHLMSVYTALQVVKYAAIFTVLVDCKKNLFVEIFKIENQTANL